MLPSALHEFQFTPDGSSVIYRGEQNTDDIDELFQVPVAGGTPTQISTPGDNLFNYTISADGNRVVYQTSTGGQGLDELFSVQVLGGTVTQLNAPVLLGDTVGFFELSADSTTVIYSVESIDGDEEPSTALFSVPIGGGSLSSLRQNSLTAEVWVDLISVRTALSWCMEPTRIRWESGRFMAYP